MNLTDDEVRERFSAYHEGELDGAEAEYVRRRLAENDALAREFERFRAMLSGLASIGLDEAGLARASGIPAPPVTVRSSDPDGQSEPGGASATANAHTDVENVDLLGGIQKRIHRRSRGRFFRTRHSRRAGSYALEISAAVALVVLGLIWLTMMFVTEVKPAQAPSPGSGPPSTTPRDR